MKENVFLIAVKSEGSQFDRTFLCLLSISPSILSQCLKFFVQSRICASKVCGIHTHTKQEFYSEIPAKSRETRVSPPKPTKQNFLKPLCKLGLHETGIIVLCF